MKCIKLFKEQTAFDKAKSTLDRPNVSLVKENNNVYLLKKKNANGYSYVDLGLPSGTLWATMNVGATSESDYGSYFQWGDTVDKSNADCTWTIYKHCNGSNKALTKYCTNSEYGTVDNKTTLDPEDDAVRVYMGGDWRIPTQTEFDELLSGTTNEWIADYDGTGVSGRKFTSKTDTSKYIFIPAAGFRSDSSFQYQGSAVAVWSSSLYTSLSDCAWELSLSSDSPVVSYSARSFGLVVRGVL